MSGQTETIGSRASPALEKMFEPLRAYLYENAGIFFQDSNKDRFLRHVAERMHASGKSDPQAYLALLKGARGPGSELWQFFNQVTVNETYFFREPGQFDILRDKVLPQLFARRREQNKPNVTIWSAACSSGEEAYTLAILLKECFPSELGTTKILGFDISSDVVEKARKGLYTDYSVRHCADGQRANYFKKEGNLHQLVPYIRRMATFHVANLMDAVSLRSLPRPDLVMCRNVLIYFDRQSKSKVLNNLASVLLPPGYLFLSQSEALFNVEHPFDLVHFFKAFAYRLKPS